MEKKSIKKLEVIIAARGQQASVAARDYANRKQSVRLIDGDGENAYINSLQATTETLEKLVNEYDLQDPKKVQIYVISTFHNAFKRYLDNVRITRNVEDVDGIELFIEGKENGMPEFEADLWRRFDAALVALDGVRIERAKSQKWVTAKAKDIAEAEAEGKKLTMQQRADQLYASLSEAAWNELPEAQFDGFEIIEDTSLAF